MLSPMNSIAKCHAASHPSKIVKQIADIGAVFPSEGGHKMCRHRLHRANIARLSASARQPHRSGSQTRRLGIRSGCTRSCAVDSWCRTGCHGCLRCRQSRLNPNWNFGLNIAQSYRWTAPPMSRIFGRDIPMARYVAADPNEESSRRGRGCRENAGYKMSGRKRRTPGDAPSHQSKSPTAPGFA